jgi:predicted membrane protein
MSKMTETVASKKTVASSNFSDWKKRYVFFFILMLLVVLLHLDLSPFSKISKDWMFFRIFLEIFMVLGKRK